MLEIKFPSFYRLIALSVAMVALLASSGCLAVGLGTAAAGGAVGYAYYRGGVQRAYPVTLKAGSRATQDAMLKLGMPLTHATHSEKETSLQFNQGQANGTRIRIWLEQITSPNPGEGVLTVITVRVGTFGDQELSERILAEIARHLSLPVEPGSAAPTRLTPLALDDPTNRIPQPPSAPSSLQNIQPPAQTGATNSDAPLSNEPPIFSGSPQNQLLPPQSAGPPLAPPLAPQPGAPNGPAGSQPGVAPGTDPNGSGKLVPIPAGAPRP